MGLKARMDEWVRGVIQDNPAANKIKDQSQLFPLLIKGLGALIAMAALYAISSYNYLLFHTLVEIFGVVIAGTIFILGWNSRRLTNSAYLLYIGVAFLFTAFFQVLHLVAYKGMDIFPGFRGANLATQLWLIERYMLSVSFLAMPAFLHRRVRGELLIVVYGLISAFLMLATFVWKIFPVAYIDNVGLTPFKLVSEHIIILIFAAALALIYRERKSFDPQVLRLFSVALLLNIVSEFAFTQYVGVYDFANMVGHYLLVFAYYFTYKAIIEIGIVRPYNLMFRDLINQREALQAAKNELETRVRERTHELLKANQDLTEEMQERQRMQAELDEVKTRLIDSTESERVNLARELHDGPMQDLYGLTYQLELLRDGLAPQEREQVLDATKLTLEDVISSLRSTAGELRPPALTSFGLEKAIRSHCSVFCQAQPNLKIHLDLDKDGQLLPERTRLALYRIYQVALVNVVRHSHATQVDVRFQLLPDSVVLEVQDNGQGFIPPLRWVELARGGHMGLVGAKERAEAAGGTFEVHSTPGQGTLLRVVLPLSDS